MSDINVTPLVDVMLVLLVIFLITAPLMGSALRLDLPAAQAPISSTPANAVRLSLDGKNQIFLDDKQVAFQDLPAVFALQAGVDPSTEVQLQADQQVPYGRVAEVMGLLQKAGLHKVALAVQPPAPKIQATSPPLRP